MEGRSIRPSFLMQSSFQSQEPGSLLQPADGNLTSNGTWDLVSGLDIGLPSTAVSEEYKRQLGHRIYTRDEFLERLKLERGGAPGGDA